MEKKKITKKKKSKLTKEESMEQLKEKLKHQKNALNKIIKKYTKRESE